MAKSMSPKAVAGLAKFRKDLKSGKINMKDIRQKHVHDLEVQLEKAKLRVKEIEEKLDAAKKVGVKSATKKAVDGLTAEQLVKLNEMIAKGEI